MQKKRVIPKRKKSYCKDLRPDFSSNTINHTDSKDILHRKRFSDPLKENLASALDPLKSISDRISLNALVGNEVETLDIAIRTLSKFINSKNVKVDIDVLTLWDLKEEITKRAIFYNKTGDGSVLTTRIIEMRDHLLDAWPIGS